MTSQSRTKNTLRNIGFGFLYRAAAILFPFLTRTLLIYKLGSEYLGLSGLFSSVLQVLSLAELGFGSAIVYSLYRPIAEQNDRLVCAYRNLFRKIYHIIGVIILSAGLLIIPILPRLIKDPVLPEGMNLYLCYLIFLFDSVISYLLFGYKTVLPQATQRLDLISKIDIGIVITRNLCQILLVFLFRNFYLYLILTPLSTIVRNLVIANLTKRWYPQYTPRGELTPQDRKNLITTVKGIAIGKLSITSRNGIDNICLSMFLGLTTVAIYNNYYYILNMVVNLSMIFCSSLMPSVGNSIATETKTKNLQDFHRLEFAYMGLAGWATTALLCLYQPFMRLWMGENRLLAMPEVILFAVYFYLLKMGDMRWIYQEGAGLWWECRHVTVIETIANIALNILLGKLWGVFGIILATDLSMLFFNFIGSGNVVFSKFFPKEARKNYYLGHLRYLIVNSAIILLTYGASSFTLQILNDPSPLVSCIIVAILCVLIPPIGYWIIYHRGERYKYWAEWIKEKTEELLLRLKNKR